MSYSQLAKVATELGQGKELASKMWQPNKGDILVGKLIAVDLFQSATINKPCNRYTFDTDDGIMTCLMGNATDDKIKHSLKLDVLTSVTFQGTMEIPGGRKAMNVFSVVQYPGVALDVEDPDLS